MWERAARLPQVALATRDIIAGQKLRGGPGIVPRWVEITFTGGDAL